MLKTMMHAACALLCALIMTGPARAIEPQQVPEPLRPWVDWALHGDNEAGCPFLYSEATTRRCAWGSALELQLRDSGGGFAQHWQVQRSSWIPLPGDGRHWPQEVRLDGKPAIVAERGGRPMLRLEAGGHAVSGDFAWDKLPEALQLAPDTGIVVLTLGGQAVAAPYVDEQGRLWLQRRAATAAAEDHLELRVHRLLDDDIPLQLTTRLQLSVSGKARDLLLAPALLPGFTPLSLQSPLPARLEADGRLRVQARAGTWEITLAARHDGPLNKLTLPMPAKNADQDSRAAEEVWAFAAHNQLRLVSIEGAPALDPQQTTLPEEWKIYPAYRMQPGSVLTLAEKKRGDPEPAPDQLRLQRTLWLDFDGGGYTLQDRISGSINRGWRLDMALPIQLGRVALLGLDGRNAQDQLITQGKNGAAGVELRQGQVNLVAESRLPRDGARMAAVGWLQDFQGAAAELRLPPGWKLFAAAGVDQAPGSWLRSWNLLDIFLVLVVALAVARLWGRNWGLLALLAMALIYPEMGAPRWVWLNLLAAAALLRYLPAGMALKLASAYRVLAFIGLVLIALPFAVQQIRIGLFPALEKPWGGVAPAMPRQAAYQPASLPAAAPEAALMEEEVSADVAMQAKVAGLSASVRAGVASTAAPEPAKKAPLNLAEHDPGARIQTGPGLPEWGWNSYQLQWNGPLRHDQTLQLWLLSPAMNLLLAVLRVALLLLLAWRVLDLPSGWRPSFRPQAATLALAALLLGGAPVDRAWAELPSPEMLQQLRQRLTEAPPCLPQCASSPRLLVEAKGGMLRIRQEIHTLADVAVPLPGGDKHWLPGRVLVDGEPHAGLLRRGDAVWLHLPKGSHQVLLEGALPERETVEIPLPLRPHRVEAAIDGWTLAGVHDDGQPDDNLRLTRVRQQAGPSSSQPSEALPPFVRITRTLHLGLEWQVETRVTRLSPPGTAVVLEVPLLQGESVISDWLRSKDGRAQLSMAPTVDEVAWTSTLREVPQLALTAASQNQWAETWQVDASPIWHVEFAGIPPVGHQDADGRRLPTFRPWPGEQLQVTISRPAAVAGQTLTIDGTQLSVQPGLRDTDASLELRVRSSQGGQHTVTLPAGAELLDVSINGQTQPIRAQNGKVVLPVVPGAQTFKLAFREPHGMGWRAATPVLDVGSASVNARITLQPPQDRWTLFLGGPRLGPAVLFWGVLLVLAALSWGLGKVPLTPLKMHEWLLLGLGLTQTPPETALVIVGWLLVLGWRGREGAAWSNNRFNLTQILLMLWTLAAFSALFYAIQHGLLGLPEMQIEGNGSSAYQLNWFQDRSGAVLPVAWVISLPLFVYRLLMLAWALWLAAALLRWLRWGWGCYMAGGLWRKLVSSSKKQAAASGADPTGKEK